MLDRALEEFITTGRNSGAGGCHDQIRLNTHPMMTRAIVLQDLHASPGDLISAGQSQTIDIAIRTGGRLSDDGPEVIFLDDAHHSLGSADCPPIREEDTLSLNEWLSRPDGPTRKGRVAGSRPHVQDRSSGMQRRMERWTDGGSEIRCGSCPREIARRSRLRGWQPPRKRHNGWLPISAPTGSAGGWSGSERVSSERRPAACRAGAAALVQQSSKYRSRKRQSTTDHLHQVRTCNVG